MSGVDGEKINAVIDVRRRRKVSATSSMRAAASLSALYENNGSASSVCARRPTDAEAPEMRGRPAPWHAHLARSVRRRPHCGGVAMEQEQQFEFRDGIDVLRDERADAGRDAIE